MARKPGHQCDCLVCKAGTDQAVILDHRQLNELLDRLDERQRRWAAAREAMKLGYGGVRHIATVTGMHPETIRRGRAEINSGFANCPDGRIRAPGGGRPRVEKKIRH